MLLIHFKSYYQVSFGTSHDVFHFLIVFGVEGDSHILWLDYTIQKGDVSARWLAHKPNYYCSWGLNKDKDHQSNENETNKQIMK